MHILIATDKFKNSLTSYEACEAIETGLRQALPHVVCTLFPLADGGDGTGDILTFHSKGSKVNVKVHDPLFRPIEAWYGLSQDGSTAFIEMANASGLRLLKNEERDVVQTTTLGTGELIADAIIKGVKRIILGIGGSATSEAGVGAATALGFEFVDENGQPVKPVGGELVRIKAINTHKVNPKLKDITFTAICDVDNPLTGVHGAAHVYAPQKGASPHQVQLLEEGLKNVARIVKDQFSKDIERLAGAGAGGGFGAGAIAFFNATLKRGVDVVFEVTKFEEAVKTADIIITGEGKMDQQTLRGKLIVGISTVARKHRKKVVAIVGINELSRAETESAGVDHVIALTDAVSEKEAVNNAFNVLRDVSTRDLAAYISKMYSS